MGSIGYEAHGQGNNSILIKVDKLRELIGGSKVSLPQLVVVGDQSSGKSSVLEGLTGFAFPRAAELCTRYATQITCKRDVEESITVSIIPNLEANQYEQERVKRFRRTLTEMTPDSLAQLFKDANEAMGIRTAQKATAADGSALPAFSEHILKVEKLGPNEEHFTVIDVPGIFRQETEGLTDESDIELVRRMVKGYMKDSRTIILAIMACNNDLATQEILKLARDADPTMTRTMAVLTKPDLAIERTMQQIAIDHVIGKRKNDLTLGYYVVKNRGSDDTEMTLEQGFIQERHFFATAPWSALNRTGRAGMDNLKVRVRDLLIDLIKREFPKVRADIFRDLAALRSQREKMGPSRSNEYTQRAYLNKISQAFQTISRDALNAYYTGNKLFNRRHDLRLITRVVEASENFGKAVEQEGHMWQFAADPGSNKPALKNKKGESLDDFLKNPRANWRDISASGRAGENFGKAVEQEGHMWQFAADPGSNKPALKNKKGESLDDFLDLNTTRELLGDLKNPRANWRDIGVEYPELEDLLDFNTDVVDMIGDSEDDIMDYIEKVYKSSRGQDLGTFGGSLLEKMFKEQSAKWEPITLAYIGHVILLVHHFITEVVGEICPDAKVREQLWDSFLLEELQKSYARAIDRARFLLEIEREGPPLTLNHYFNDNLQKWQSERLVLAMKELGLKSTLAGDKAYNWDRDDGKNADDDDDDADRKTSGVFLTWAQLGSLPANKANAEHVREYMHDVLKSYYKVSRKRFVDVVCQQAVNHGLLRGAGGPLGIFTTDMVLGLTADQLDMIAAEDAPVKEVRARLDREIAGYEDALKVLKGSSS